MPRMVGKRSRSKRVTLGMMRLEPIVYTKIGSTFHATCGDSKYEIARLMTQAAASTA